MKILAFAASNYSNSINKQLVSYISSKFEGHDVEVLDINDYEMPIYSIDREVSGGVPKLAEDFAAKIDGADLLIISLAEYNGSYSTAFKNIFDWISRIPNRSAFGDKKVFLTATAPGPRGGLTILETAKARFPYNGGNVIEDFSLPNFSENFDLEKGIIDEEKKKELESKILKIKKEYLNE